MRMKEWHEMSMARPKPSRETSATRPCKSPAGAKAIECSRKSSRPHRSRIASKTASIAPDCSTLSGIMSRKGPRCGRDGPEELFQHKLQASMLMIVVRSRRQMNVTWSYLDRATFVGVVGTAIRELRTALNDDARKPRFIETVSRPVTGACATPGTDHCRLVDKIVFHV